MSLLMLRDKATVATLLLFSHGSIPSAVARRSLQYECFQKLVYVYENEPENAEKLMQLMQDVQE